jgi:hypothetical protein
MEKYVDRYDLRQERILHIGIGNSGFAQRFHRRVKEIVGTTIDHPEMEVASRLRLPNYRFFLHNKFSGKNDTVPGKFDFILDNNPTSPCCCVRHLVALFDFYLAKLATEGQVVTDLQGLEWVPDGSDPRWGFDFEDLAAVASAAGLSAFKANRKVFVLSRVVPSSPGPAGVLRHFLRRAANFPGKVLRNGPGAIRRMCRKSLDRLGLSAVSSTRRDGIDRKSGPPAEGAE